MKYYCIHCRRITETENVQRVHTSKNAMLRGVCAVCGRIKTQFTTNNK